MKPKILFLVHLPPPIHGSSVMGAFLANSKLINETFQCRFQNIILSDNILETGKLTFRKVKALIRIFYKLALALLKEKPDICYLALSISDVAFFKDALLVLLLKVFRVKPVFHLHNKGIHLKKRNFINQKIYKTIFAGADVIILSKYLYPEISDLVPESKVHLCPNGIPASKISAEKPHNSIPKILFLSNYFESKGVNIVLDACRILAEKGLKFHCNCVGEDGNISRQNLEQKVLALGLSDYITCVGPKFGLEKEHFYHSADIFVFPTFYPHETFGLVNLEAMQYQLPVISTFEGGIPDIVLDGHTGFLVPQKDVESVAEKLEHLITDPHLRKRMGQAGYMRYKKGFTIEVFENKMAGILSKIAHRKDC